MNLYWDVSNRKFVQSTTSTAEVVRVKLVLRDEEPISLIPLDSSNSPATLWALDSGESIDIALKSEADLDGNYLAFAAGLTDNTLAGTLKRYTGNLDIDTAAAVAAIGTADYLDCILEVCVVTSASKQRYSSQVDVRLLKDVIRGETPPAGAGGLSLRFITDGGGNKGVGLYNADGVLLQEFYPPGV
jgi:hypothetical protein